MASAPLFEIDALHVSAVDGPEIVRGVDLTIDHGEVHAIMGPNGSGKSTLATTLMGSPEYEVTSGAIRFQGDDVTEDMVLSRILWLEGLENGNANTKERYIYIHGTNDEEQIGQPVSIGCVRMKNADVVALYDQVSVGTEVEIMV